MKLIDKDALLAEIERRVKTNKECMLGLRNLDYYKDIPLAKEGEKVKVIVIKED